MISTTLHLVDEFAPLQARMAVFFVVRGIKKTCASVLQTAEFIFYGTKARAVRVNTSTAVRSRVRGEVHN